MRKIVLSMAAAPLISAVFAVNAMAGEGYSILNDVKFNGEIRPRYEMADVDNGTTDTANALTTRLTLGMKAALPVEGMSTYIEATSVNNFGYKDYYENHVNDSKFALILDPQQARVTQAYVDYKAGDTLIRAGRQMVNLDDQRFVGAVGWRQMFQTFDAVAVADSSVKNLKLLGAYVFGQNSVAYNQEAINRTAVLLNASYRVADALSVTGYGYLLGSIHDTYGLRLNGKVALEGVTLDYDASYAIQKDPSLEYGNAGKPVVDAEYYSVAAGASMTGIFGGLGYEVLGEANSGSTKGFTTPLATLHKFQGWADVFLGRTAGSNNDGLGDMNAKIGYKNAGFGKAMAVYHKFDAMTGANKDLGSEIDVMYANKIAAVKGLDFLAKAAFYTKGDSGADVTKYWIQLDYKF